MLVYGVCVGPGTRYETLCRPALEVHCAGPVVERRGQQSIFEAYLSIIDEATERWPTSSGLVLLHDDVEILDPHLDACLRRLLASPGVGVGVVGVVGGRDPVELSWWTTPDRYGHCRYTAHVDDFTRGDHEVSSVDGLLLALSPAAVAVVRRELRQGHYPAWHGYDGEICALVRRAGLSVMVSDIELVHHFKGGPWGRAIYGVALMEWRLRWRPASRSQRAVWLAKRAVLSLAARLGR